MKNTRFITAAATLAAVAAFATAQTAPAATLDEVVAEKTYADCIAARDVVLLNLGSSVVTLGDLTCIRPGTEREQGTLAADARDRHRECLKVATPKDCYERGWTVEPIGDDDEAAGDE